MLNNEIDYSKFKKKSVLNFGILNNNYFHFYSVILFIIFCYLLYINNINNMSLLKILGFY